MEKEKSPAMPCGGLPPPSPAGWCAAFSDSVPFTLGSSDANRLNHDVNRMLENPPKKIGHRRAHSEILNLPDDLSFDWSELGVVGTNIAGDGTSFSDDTEEELRSMYRDMDKFNLSASSSAAQVGEPSAWNIEPVMIHTGLSSNPQNMVSSFGEGPRVRHQQSLSVDGSMDINADMLMSGNGDGSAPLDGRKSMSAAKLAELALIDPKRAKRILANRQSAARSKERKNRYTFDLERKVRTLQEEATTLSAQLRLLQRETNSLTVENNELKLRLQTKEQQVHLQDELSEALKEEIQRLKLLIGQLAANSGPAMNYGSFGSNQQFYSNNDQSMQTMLAAQQFQQLQIDSQKQQQEQQQYQFQQQQLLHYRLQQQEQQNGVAEMRTQNLPLQDQS